MLEIDNWASDQEFDKERVRRGMALWILQAAGMEVDLDGQYHRSGTCVGTNCPAVLRRWQEEVASPSGVSPPAFPPGLAEGGDPSALVPFEKFLIVRHILRSGGND